MNFKSFIFLTLTLFSVSIVTSCKTDPDPTPIDTTPRFQKNGVFIISEGLFGSGAGSLAFFDITDQALTNNVFETQNNGALIGNVFQSMALFHDKGFLVGNNAQRVDVVKHDDMTSVGTITGLNQPRFVAERNDREAYVSQWGATGVTGQIMIVNTTDFSIVDSITIGGGPEQLLVAESKLYVPNSGGFGADSVLNIYDTSDNNLIKSVEVGSCPSRLLKSDDGTIWVASGCYGQQGAITKMINDEATNIYPFEKGQLFGIDESSDGEVLFLMHKYTDQKGIYRFHKSSATFEDTPVVAGSFYGLGVDKGSDKLYLGNAAGSVYVYDLDASNMPSLVDSMMVGEYPNGFIFQE